MCTYVYIYTCGYENKKHVCIYTCRYENKQHLHTPCKQGGFPLVAAVKRNVGAEKDHMKSVEYVYTCMYTDVYMKTRSSCTKDGYLRMATVERLLVADKEGRILVKYIYTCICIYKCIYDIQKDLHKGWIPPDGYS